MRGSRLVDRRRRGSVARTVSHDNYDYRCRTAAADPYWYRSRCYYRCTAVGTAGYHSRCHCCDRWLEAAGHKQWGHDPISGHQNVRKRTTEISFILVPSVLSRKGDTVSSVACLLHSSMVAAIRGSRRP